jgi:uncharacterized membrane protein YeaQ/YmgE (transglycosylase-associated protein family)
MMTAYDHAVARSNRGLDRCWPLGGSLAGLIITWDRKGFGFLRNLAVGLAGALVGGFIFRMLGLLPGLDKFAISLRDVVAAVVGSLLVLSGLLWHRSRASQ